LTQDRKRDTEPSERAVVGEEKSITQGALLPSRHRRVEREYGATRKKFFFGSGLGAARVTVRRGGSSVAFEGRFRAARLGRGRGCRHPRPVYHQLQTSYDDTPAPVLRYRKGDEPGRTRGGGHRAARGRHFQQA
ncbi:unnamed protein product, partial [Hapterophycus canaliculatus]